MKRHWLLPLVPFVVIASAAAQARAATLTVNTGIDSVSPGPGLCSLREAIQAVDSPGSTQGGCAPAAFGPNTIMLGQGAYNLDAPNGELTVAPSVTSLTITGAGEWSTVINASGLGDRILEVKAGASVAITDLLLTGGHAPDGASGSPGAGSTSGGPGGNGANGGAILNAGTLSLVDAAVTNSAAGAGGAGGNAFNSIAGNPAANGGGGGAGGSGGAIFNTGSLTLNGVTIDDDRAGNGGAGGPGGQGDGPITGGTGGSGGAGGDGGGVANVGGDVQIIASTLAGDSSGTGGAGGAGGPGWCCVSPSVGGPGGAGGNGTDGGGVWSSVGTLSLTNSTLVSNVSGNAGAGGAGGNQSENAGPGPGGPGGNGGGGGGVDVDPWTTANMLNATVVGNTGGAPGAGGPAGQGTPAAAAGASGASEATGGIRGEAGAAVTVQNSLLALNAGGNCGPGSVVDAGHNLSFGDASCPLTFGSGDPKLGAFGDNGGPTDTIGLGAGSAAIDQIPPSGAGCPATDQRGVPRPSASGCDIGAYEVAPPAVTAGSVQVLGAHKVLITGLVTPNAGSAEVSVEYGKTASLGHQSGVETVGGVTPAKVTIALTGLDLRSVYHYRIVATSDDGTTQSADQKLAVPILTALHLVPAVFREVGKRGPRTVLSYHEARAAVTTFAVQRREGRKWVTIGKFRHRDRRGRNGVRWDGRLAGRRLAPGLYRLLATPSSAGVTGPTAGARFRIT